MESKRRKTQHPEPDARSICSSESETVCASDSDTKIFDHDLADESDESPFSFLSLSKELRFMIYHCAFSTSSEWEELIRVTVERKFYPPGTHPSKGIKLKYTRNPPLHLPIALLQTNRQIYHEALPVLFSGVVFSFASNPTSLTFLLDHFSGKARNSIRYLRLYPAPLYARNGPLGEQLSWAVLCAQVAQLPFLKRVDIIYNRVEDLRLNSVKSQHALYGKSLALIRATKEPEFERHATTAELNGCRDRFRDITGPAPAYANEV